MEDDTYGTIDISTIDANDLDKYLTTTTTDYSIGDINYDASTYITSIYNGNSWNTITSVDTSTINYDTGMKVDGDLIVKGRNITEELDIVKTLLDGAVIQRDPTMEEEFQKLKAIADEYQTQLAKYKSFKALKDSK